MPRLTPTRVRLTATLRSVAMLCAGVVLLAASLPVAAQMQHPQFQEHQHSNQMGGHEHIGTWMADHQNLTPDEQQHALAAEPGFQSLPPEQQQRMQQRLTQLNSMPPEQRQRTIDRIEGMEKLTPDQRQQVRSAMSELSSLPRGRRRAVARTFHELRTMPPDQRAQLMGSPDFQHQFSDQERGTINNLMAIDPYLPAPTPWR